MLIYSSQETFEIPLLSERDAVTSPSNSQQTQIHAFKNSLNSALTGSAKSSPAIMFLKHLLCPWLCRLEMLKYIVLICLYRKWNCTCQATKLCIHIIFASHFPAMSKVLRADTRAESCSSRVTTLNAAYHFQGKKLAGAINNKEV